MDVQKYFQTVASLNSLVCNLATSLACGVDEKLIYTVGYAEDGDGCIRSNEACLGHDYGRRDYRYYSVCYLRGRKLFLI